jgi:hypothetical protein
VNKKDLIATFAQHLETELTALKSAAQATYDAATNEESRPENEYDTRALEASYLAGAQAKRVSEVTEVLSLFKTLEFKDFTRADSVQSTALVYVTLDGRKTRLLMMPKGGGEQLQLADAPVQIVTPSSALGESILGQKVGDVVEFDVGRKVHECEIVGIQ